MRRAAVLAGTLVLLAGCASAARSPAPARRSATNPHAVTLACPVRTPAPGGTTLPSAPVDALACLADEPPAKRAPGVPVPRDVAAVLAHSVDAAPGASAAELRQCPRTGTGVHVVIRFAAPDGTVTDLVEAAPACGSGIAYVGNAGRAITRALGDFVFALTSTATDPSRIADVIGGRRSPACTGRQLRASYRAGGVGTGNDFGRLVIRNISAAWCELRGPVQVVGLDDRGRPVTRTAAATQPEPLSLAPRSREPTASVELVAEYRDDPTAPDGLCEPHWVAPHSWRLDVADRPLVVRNGRGDPELRPGANGLVTCRGTFSATLRGRSG